MKTSPLQLFVMGLFALAALSAVGVLSGVIKLPQSADQNISGNVVIWGTIVGLGLWACVYGIEKIAGRAKNINRYTL